MTINKNIIYSDRSVYFSLPARARDTPGSPYFSIGKGNPGGTAAGGFPAAGKRQTGKRVSRPAINLQQFLPSRACVICRKNTVIRCIAKREQKWMKLLAPVTATNKRHPDISITDKRVRSLQLLFRSHLRV